MESNLTLEIGINLILRNRINSFYSINILSFKTRKKKVIFNDFGTFKLKN